MPRGRWILLVALGLALGGNVQPVNDRGNSQGSAAERKENENPKAPLIAPINQQVSAPNVSPEHERYAEEERQRGRDDLVAQQASAFWTRVMGIVAIFALTLSTAGVWLIYTTFRETRRAASSAQRTYEAFVNVERPRLVVIPELVCDFAEHIMKVQMSVSNIGRSTAALIESRFDMQVGVEFPEAFKCTSRLGGTLQPGSNGTFQPAVIDVRELKEKPFLGGYVEYRTPFGGSHRTYFLTMIGEWEVGTNVMSVKPHPYTDQQSRKRFGWPDDD